MSRRAFLVASRNEGKLRELADLFAARGLTIRDLTDAGVEPTSDEDAIESFDTFEENALAKARHFYELTGLPTFADDSGLTIDALGGKPGVRSKRWSGRTDLTGRGLDAANNAKMIAEVRGAGGFPSRASYVCAAAFVDDAREVVRVGTTAGSMVQSPRGTDGFGYDAHFLSDELGATFGEASIADKRGVSHRGRAFAELLGALGL